MKQRYGVKIDTLRADGVARDRKVTLGITDVNLN